MIFRMIPNLFPLHQKESFKYKANGRGETKFSVKSCGHTIMKHLRNWQKNFFIASLVLQDVVFLVLIAITKWVIEAISYKCKITKH